MSSPRLSRLNRRQALALIGSASLAGVACTSTPASPSASGSTPGPVSSGGGGQVSPPASGAQCAVSPTETVGPFPSLGDYVRRNITDGKPGLPLTLTIAVVNVSAACAPVTGATVDVWQCDHEGTYSEYGTGRGQMFLRGMQTTDAQGQVIFETVYPGWYQGRATHIHVEVLMGGRSVKVTQIAFPEDITSAVYRTGVYAAKGQNATTNARDNVFADGFSQQLITLSGTPSSGYTGTFTVGVAL